ncbi:MAG: hypothetical protein NTU78_06395 [Alphaproteobacteria bacterium]|jgi:hypothetical protein|nr:hypothetical protein [Alphaproteobacteria bacterium]
MLKLFAAAAIAALSATPALATDAVPPPAEAEVMVLPQSPVPAEEAALAAPAEAASQVSPMGGHSCSSKRQQVYLTN